MPTINTGIGQISYSTDNLQLDQIMVSLEECIEKNGPIQTLKILSTNDAEASISKLRSLFKGKGDNGTYYGSWKANIAMSFSDTVRNSGSLTLTEESLLELANKAAESFLDRLIS